MPFGMVSGVGRAMGVLDGGSDRRRGKGCFGVNLGHPIVINGDSVGQLCKSNTLFLHDFGRDLL